MSRSPRVSTQLCLALVAASTALACASSIKTAFDTDPSADMSVFETYAWIDVDAGPPTAGAQQGPYVSPLDDKRIRSAVDGQLRAKGYVASEPSRADLIVHYSVRAEEKVRVTQTAGRSSYYHGGYRYGTWYAGSTVNVQQYTEGTMTIEFFDRKTKDALWVGWGSKRLSKSNDRDEVIKEAVQKILKPLPTRM